jgi:Ca2+-binding EF-hand superfamily protein
VCFVVFTIIFSNNFAFSGEEKGHICFRIVDKDKDGKVTFQEYTKYFGEDKKKFEAIDQDNDGNLTHDEYHQSLGHGVK